MIKLLLLINFFTNASPLKEDSIPAVVKGRLQSALNSETSGVAASFVNKGLLYIHNDSGDSSRFFLIAADGSLKAIYRFAAIDDKKTTVLDCEDIATGAGPVPGRSYIYLGDIGDNASRRRSITVYRTEEPVFVDSAQLYNGSVKMDPLYVRYPDGMRDAEAMMIDPVEELLYIISKREDSVRVYTTPLNYAAGDTVTLTKRGSLFFKGFFLAKQVTSADVSGDGRQVLVKTYSKVYYWKRKGKEPLWKLLMEPPAELPYKIEAQGEAIGFNTAGTGYFTISEGIKQPIYYYKLPK